MNNVLNWIVTFALFLAIAILFNELEVIQQKMMIMQEKMMTAWLDGDRDREEIKAEIQSRLATKPSDIMTVIQANQKSLGEIKELLTGCFNASSPPHSSLLKLTP